MQADRFSVGSNQHDPIASFDNRLACRAGTLHLSFRLGTKLIGYAYIRKNGCSTFKMALGYDPSADVSEVASEYPFVRGSHDAMIFVWRDPLERVVSLYKNKVLERRNASDLLAAYHRAMGEPPSSFERFVEFACLQKDPHCWPQRDHLMRLRYTHAIPLSRLHEAMSAIAGERAAEPFRIKGNSTGSEQVDVSNRAAAMVRRCYARDYSMIRRIRWRLW